MYVQSSVAFVLSTVIGHVQKFICKMEETSGQKGEFNCSFFFGQRLLRYQWLEDSLTSGEKANEDLYLLKFGSGGTEEPNKSLPARSGSEDQPSTPKRARDSPDSSDTVGLETQKNTQGSPTTCSVPSTSASPTEEGISEIHTTSPQSEVDNSFGDESFWLKFLLISFFFFGLQTTSVYKPPDLNRNITEIFGKLINIYRGNTSGVFLIALLQDLNLVVTLFLSLFQSSFG